MDTYHLRLIGWAQGDGVCIALVESGRDGDVQQIGVFENRPELLMKLAARLSKGGRRLSFCYEAGPLWLWVAPAADRLWA